MKPHAFIGTAVLLLAVAPANGATLSAGEAADHVGEVATVCGVVASAKYATSVKGKPTFLNLDEAYPHQVFTALIWNADRKSFSSPPESLSGHQICVTGTITEYKGKAEIVVHGPDAITEK